MEHQAKKSWTDLETFTEPGSELAVRVQASDDERPVLSFQTGRVREGRFMPHHRNRYNTEGGVVTLERMDTAVLAKLVGRAQDLIERKLQEREDEFQARRRDRVEHEARKQLGNKPKQRNGHSGGRGKRDNWDYDR